MRHYVYEYVISINVTGDSFHRHFLNFPGIQSDVCTFFLFHWLHFPRKKYCGATPMAVFLISIQSINVIHGIKNDSNIESFIYLSFYLLFIFYILLDIF